MEYRKFGGTDLIVSEVSLGCNKLGRSIFDSNNKRNNEKLISKAIELGINLFDLAPTYSYGDTERLIGHLLGDKRKEICLSTKCGRLPSSLAKYGKNARHFSKIINPVIAPFRSNLKKASKPRFDFSSKNLIQSVEASLQRLNTDYLDLLLLHNPSLEVLQKGEVFECLQNLKSEGKIRYYGASIDTVDEANEALKYPIDALQITFNIIQNNVALQIFEGMKKECGIMVKTPFLRGLLSSKNYLKTEYFDDNTALSIKNKRDKLNFLAEHRSWNHIAMNYLLEHPHVSTILCGTSSTTHLKDNLNYGAMPKFTELEWQQINEIQKSFSL